MFDLLLQISQKQQSNQDDLGDETKILDQVTLLNKDTGECRSLSQADDILPKCINPLNPHLSKLANDYQSDEDESQPQASEEPTTLEEGDEPGTTLKTSAFKIGVKKLGKFGHGFIKGVKNVRGGALGASEGTLAVASGTTSSDTKFYRDSVTIDPRILNLDPHDLLFPSFKLKTNRKKDAADFEGLRLIQELNDCRGAVWCMKWSSCGQLLAVAGQDQLLRVYCSHKSWKHFTQARSKASSQQISPNSTKEKSVNNSRNNSISSSENVHSLSDSRSRNNLQQEDNNSLAEEDPLLLFSVYRGHTADVLDISWSKNNFLLSSSMDKTVKLWHITRVECLCTFCHKDFVSTINFHPRDDRYFLSGSLDGVLRLWNIPDKRLTLFNEVMAPSAASQKSSNKSNQEMTPSHGLITASAFVENGKFAVIGTYDGRVIFYSTDQLKYSTQIHVSGGKNVSSVTDTERKKKRNSNKVTGIEGVAERKILVTTNDSRIRLYDLRDLTLECKYKGCVNYSSQIRASVSPDNKYIVCGSENSSFYVWRTREETTTGQRRDRNAQWECVRLLPPSPQAQQSGLNSNNVGPGQASKNQPAIVTSATFAPIPSYLDDKAKYIIAVADFSGSIKVFAR